MTMKRMMLVWVMMLCLMLCFNLSKAENPETILQITAEEKTQDLMAVIDRLHEQGQFASESLFLVAHKTGEELWLFSYASQPLTPGFCLSVVINGRDGTLVSAWLEE